MKKVLVTGGAGMLGTELKKLLPDATYVSSKDYDLRKEEEVVRMFKESKPDIVIHLAAHVGSLNDNIQNRTAYFDDNVLMNTLVTREAFRAGVKRMLGILSTCIYPDKIDEYPIKEERLHDGAPHRDLYSYAYAKRCLAVQMDAYNLQHGVNYTYLIPCNMYGEHCKSHGGRSHYVNALIQKIIDAKKSGKKSITLFGDGTPLRQFMHAQDLAKVIVLCIEQNIKESFNVATEENLSVHEIAKVALDACDADLEITYDETKPKGQHRKDVSITKFRTHFPDFQFTTLHDGIKQTYTYLKDR